VSDHPTPSRAMPRQATSAVAFTAPPPDGDDPLLTFTPYLHTAPRRNSITPELQRRFVATLAATGIVKAAARAIGRSLEALYRLRHRPGAEGFAAAWDAALERGARRLEDMAMERALVGTRTPIVSGGEVLGWWDKPDNALLRFLLSHRLPARYGPAAQELAPGHPAYDALAAQMQAQLNAIERHNRNEVLARAIAIQTFRLRRMRRDRTGQPLDGPLPRDPWEGELVDGVPQLPRWGDTTGALDRAQAILDELEAKPPW